MSTARIAHHLSMTSVDAQHLERYADEQVFRFNEGKGTDAARFVGVIQGVKGRRATPDDLSKAVVSLGKKGRKIDNLLEIEKLMSVHMLQHKVCMKPEDAGCPQAFRGRLVVRGRINFATVLVSSSAKAARFLRAAFFCACQPMIDKRKNGGAGMQLLLTRMGSERARKTAEQPARTFPCLARPPAAATNRRDPLPVLSNTEGEKTDAGGDAHDPRRSIQTIKYLEIFRLAR